MRSSGGKRARKSCGTRTQFEGGTRKSIFLPVRGIFVKSESRHLNPFRLRQVWQAISLLSERQRPSSCGGPTISTWSVSSGLTSAVTHCLFSARPVNQFSPHRFGCRAEEVRAAILGLALIANQSQSRLVHQRRCLQCLSGSFIRHLGRSQLPQLLINQRLQLIGSCWVTILRSHQNTGDVSKNVSKGVGKVLGHVMAV